MWGRPMYGPAAPMCDLLLRVDRVVRVVMEVAWRWRFVRT